jgi:hypothetical protein
MSASVGAVIAFLVAGYSMTAVVAALILLLRLVTEDE